MKPPGKEGRSKLSRREDLKNRWGQHTIESVSTAILVVIFAASYAYLEYYYVKDPALQFSDRNSHFANPAPDYSRVSKPIIGNMYSYHLFPMLFMFLLIGFAAVWDDLTFQLLGRRRRIKAVLVGGGNVIAAIVIEDFTWFVIRWLAPVTGDPKAGMLMQYSDWTSMNLGAIDLGSLVIPDWYLIGIALAVLAYYGGLRKSRHATAETLTR